MVFPERHVSDFLSTLDDDLALLALPRYESLYIVEDSDEVFHVDLFDGDPTIGLHFLPEGPSPAYLEHWALFAANLHHRGYVQRRIRWHAAPISDAWAAVEAQSDDVVKAVTRRFAARARRVRARAALYGISASAMLEAAARTRLSWDLQPPAPWWHRLLVGFCLARRWNRPAKWLERFRRTAFSETVAFTFGTNVTARGLDGFSPYDRKRRAKQRENRARERRARRQRLVASLRADLAELGVAWNTAPEGRGVAQLAAAIVNLSRAPARRGEGGAGPRMFASVRRELRAAYKHRLPRRKTVRRYQRIVTRTPYRATRKTARQIRIARSRMTHWRKLSTRQVRITRKHARQSSKSARRSFRLVLHRTARMITRQRKGAMRALRRRFRARPKGTDAGTA
jgi:hypothetical protein